MAATHSNSLTKKEANTPSSHPLPPLESLISVDDFAKIARQTFSPKTFAFYSSAATDLVSHEANLQCHRQLLLRPRVLRNVQSASTKRRILGCDSAAPFFFSPAAMAKLAHPDGELALARAGGQHGIIPIVRRLIFIYIYISTTIC